MIKGIGTDIVSVTRIEKALERHGERFAKRILGDNEFKQYLIHPRQANFLAKRFAAKEAAVKALGTGFSKGIGWQDIQVDHNELGQPILVLNNQALDYFQSLGGRQLLISLTDEQDLVSAFAIFE